MKEAHKVGLCKNKCTFGDIRKGRLDFCQTRFGRKCTNNVSAMCRLVSSVLKNKKQLLQACKQKLLGVAGVKRF